jgi:hypothetical protein
MGLVSAAAFVRVSGLSFTWRMNLPVGQGCAVKEAHVNVRIEDIDVAEGRISQTGNRTAVMQSSRTSSPHFRITSNH